MQSNKHLRTFYTLIVTQVISIIGSRISGLAVGIWVYQQTGNATPLALVAFFAILPQVIAANISGMAADRYDRRLVMAMADAGQAVGTILLLISFVSGGFQVWHLYAVTLLQAVFGVFQGPAFMAATTMLVPDDHRDRANAIRQLTEPMAAIVAMALAGFIYSLVGVTGAIIIDLATFILAVVIVLNVTIPRPEKTAEGAASQGSLWQEALSGLRYLWERRPLFFMLLHISLLNFLVGSVATLITPYILARTDDEVALGVLLAVMNLGAVVGAIIMGVWGGTRPRIHTIMPGIIVTGILLAFVGAAQSSLTIGITLFVTMLPIPMINAAFASLMQAKVAPDIQGRVFAVVSQLSMLVSPLGYLIVGPLADKVFEPAVGQAGWETVAPLVGNQVGAGIGLMMIGAGMLAVIFSVIVYAIPAIRHMEAALPDYHVNTNDPQPVETTPEAATA